jgi:hypothetical protein
MQPLDQAGNYMVKVSTYNTQWKEQKLYELKVNYKTNQIKILTDYTQNR